MPILKAAAGKPKKSVPNASAIWINRPISGDIAVAEWRYRFDHRPRDGEASARCPS